MEQEKERTQNISLIQKDLQSLKHELGLSMTKELSMIAEDKNSLIRNIDLKIDMMKSMVENYGEKKNDQLSLVGQIDKKQDENFENLKNHFDKMIERQRVELTDKMKSLTQSNNAEKSEMIDEIEKQKETIDTMERAQNSLKSQISARE